MSVRINLEIGHEASLRSKRTIEGFTHDWEIYIKGCDNADIHYYVEKVVFYLHDTFANPKRVIKEPPYRVRESGYAGFSLPIEIYLRNNEEPKKIRFTYDLNLQTTGPVIKVQKEKYVFYNPNEDFRRKLMKGGAVESGTSSDNVRESSASDKLNKLKTSTNDLVKKHRVKEHKPEDSFRDLFGTPITKTSKIVITEQPKPAPIKPPVEIVNQVKIDKPPNPKKSKSKHSPKEKDRDKEKKNPEEKKKHKEEKKSKERSKDKERKEKTAKREKSPKPESPPQNRSPKQRPPSPKQRPPSPKRPPSPPPLKIKEEKKPETPELIKVKSEGKKSRHEQKESKDKHKSHEKSRNSEQKTPNKEIKPKEPQVKVKEKPIKEEPVVVKEEKPKLEAVDKPEKIKQHKHKKKDQREKKEKKDENKKEKKSADKKLEKSEFFERVYQKEEPKVSTSEPEKTIIKPPQEPGSPKTRTLDLNDSSNSSESIEEDPPKPIPKEPKIKKDKTKPDSSEKKRKRKNDENQEIKMEEQPPVKQTKENDENVKHETNEMSEEEIQEMPLNYMNMLRELQHKIMTLQDNNDLQQVVQLIAETGQFEITAQTFDFDLCTLDRNTVQKLQEFFAIS